MDLGRDLESKTALYCKALLLVVVLLLSGFVNLSEPGLTLRAISLTIVVWSSARIYYFMFYVIEKYIDPSFRFAGVGAAVTYLIGRRKREPDAGI